MGSQANTGSPLGKARPGEHTGLKKTLRERVFSVSINCGSGKYKWEKMLDIYFRWPAWGWRSGTIQGGLWRGGIGHTERKLDGF